jgi:choline dehydrogenase-like flavoprotein
MSAPNGLPVFRVFYENDDEATQRFGADSQIIFTPPADGDYVVRLTDVRGAGSASKPDDYRYTLTIRSPREADSLASGAMTPNRVTLFSAHVNGTCRMGTDIVTSGATPDGERHGIRGLYITDGSLLPTALGVNPQETIMALSMVLTERLAERHRGVQQ